MDIGQYEFIKAALFCTCEKGINNSTLSLLDKKIKGLIVQSMAE
jgi:hypothetical protein